MANDYIKLVEAVSNYYGSGSDQWVHIIQNIGTNDLGEVAKLLKQLPNVEVWTDGNGRVVNYAVNDVLRGVSSSDNIGTIIDSNTIASITDLSVETSIPSIISKTETGELSGLSGIGLKASTGTTVTGVARTISAGLGAVAVGAQLGKIIGTALYDSNPTAWDNGVLSGFSNVNWKKFAISLKNQASEGILALFGVDGDTTTMYIDENFVSYLAWYMVDKGFLDTTYTIQDAPSNMPNYDNIKKHLPLVLSPYPAISISGNKIPSIYHDNIDKGIFLVSELNSSTGGYARYFYIIGEEDSTSSVLPYNYTFENKKVNYDDAGGTSTRDGIRYATPVTEVDSVTDFARYSGQFAWLSIYNVISSGVDGITDNPNSVQFNPSNIASSETALDALKNQYPELWENAVKTKVPQEDGTEDERTYIPLPIPSMSNAYETQPITGTPSQSDPTVKPSTTPKEELDNIANTIAPPQTPTQDDNTGNGETPTIITPTQQASALWAIYNPTLGELNSLGAWLWSSNFIDQLLKIFNDPMQAIIGLHKVYATPQISGTGNIKVGYLDSGVSSNIVGNQYTYIDCGIVSLREYYGNVLDYSPYTDIKLYLPFIGIVSLDIADVTRASINVKYGVDVLTGACLASVSVYRDNAGGVLYQYSGNCACQYPLSSGSYMGMVSGTIGALGSLARGSVVGAMMGVAGMHTNIEHSGSFSGNAGAMGIKKPYLIISRPQSQMNNAFPSIQGYPSNHYTTLGDCNGFTQVKECHIENINATNYELQQIKKLLLEGVII